MTDPTTLLALAERCEQAAGPDRVLDAEIARFLILAGAEDIARSRYGWSYFTASLDAAVMLVPDGWTWARFNSGAVECLTLNGPGGSILFERGEGNSSALALCAAALRARAAML